jgi:hypothetical protein
MPAYDSMTDANGRSLADHADRLKRTLDGLAVRVRDAIAVAVGAAVDGAVQAAVRTALTDLVGGAQAGPTQPTRSYGRSTYWDDPDDGWGDARYEDPFDPDPSRRNEARCSVADNSKPPTRRWAAIVLLGGRLVAD